MARYCCPVKAFPFFFFFNCHKEIRDGLKARSSESETRQDFGEAKPRRDTGLYVSCFSLNQSCEDGVSCFWEESEPKLIFRYTNVRVNFLDVLEWTSELLSSFKTPIFGKSRESYTLFYFISIFILLTHRKATQALTRRVNN